MMTNKLCVLFIAIALLTLAAGRVFAGNSDPLIHWTCDEGKGALVKDSSGNGLDATLAGQWFKTGAIHGVKSGGDDTPILSVQLPADKRFEANSWTFMAWINPLRLSSTDIIKTRRVLTYGSRPDATIGIDVDDKGRFSYAVTTRSHSGPFVNTEGKAFHPIKTNEWAHFALTWDRAKKQIDIYINGYLQGETFLPTNFPAVFTTDGQLSIGRAGGNYSGLLDDIKIYRRALSSRDIKSEFQKSSESYGMTMTEASRRLDMQDETGELFAAAAAAWKTKDFTKARAIYEKILAMDTLPVARKCFAHLRLAQSYLIEKNYEAAQNEYMKIGATANYPNTYRAEAFNNSRELQRTMRGHPPRDPAWTRYFAPPIAPFAATVHIAPEGNDGHDGTKEKPLATLSRARDVVRAIKAKGVAGPIGILIKPGTYPVAKTIEFTAEDSGTEESPIIYRAEKKGTAIFYGGKRLSGFKPVTDGAILDRFPDESRGKVLQCDLKALGIKDYGALKMRGFGISDPLPTVELFFNGQPMTLARWPNKGSIAPVEIDTKGNTSKDGPVQFHYEDGRHGRWTKAKAAWLYGYFNTVGADITLKIASIDPNNRTITLVTSNRSLSHSQELNYYAFNLLEEIDMPGEWFLDRDSGILYFYPPSDPATATVEIGLLPTTMVMMTDVNHVRFENVRFDLGRYTAISLNTSSNCLIAGCTVTRFAGDGITIAGGGNNGILGCDIQMIGRRAAAVTGGDPETLTLGRHFVENCHLRSFARIDRTYTPAIYLEGVGNRATHNLIHDGPASAVELKGNDLIVDYNLTYDVLQEAVERGAIELYPNPSYRNISIRYNYFFLNGKTRISTAIRTDDATSGLLVYGNIFRRSAPGSLSGIHIFIGRLNVFDNNIFADCSIGINGEWSADNYRRNYLSNELDTANQFPDYYTNTVYRARYPALHTQAHSPGMNYLWRNIFYRCPIPLAGERADFDILGNGMYASGDPGFVNAAKGDYRLKPDAQVIDEIGFTPILIGEIGLYKDSYRASWPVKENIIADIDPGRHGRLTAPLP